MKKGTSRKTKKATISDSERWIFSILPADGDAGNFEESRPDSVIRVLGLLFSLMFLVLILKAFQLQIIQGNENIKKAEGNRIQENIIRAERGIIYDRNGIVLAKNIGNFELICTPTHLPKNEGDREEIYKKISRIINEESALVKEAAEKNGLDYTQPLVIKNSISREAYLELESKLDQMPGISVSINPIREYLDKTLLSHVIGYTGKISREEINQNSEKKYNLTDYIGKTGIEKYYEDDLRGIDGVKKSEVDAMGKVLAFLGEDNPVPGKNIYLTIDYRYQEKLAESLQKALIKSSSKKGAAVAINPKNGEVLALVNLPGYDSNLFARGISVKNYESLSSDQNNPLLCRVTLGEYPSGSIIKPLFALAALEEKIITKNTLIYSSGGIDVGVWNFPDWKKGGHGATNVSKAIAESVNTFFYAIAGGHEKIKGLGPTKMELYLKKFGLGNKTGIDYPAESKGLIPNPQWKKSYKGEDWYLGDTYHFGIGQGDLLVTPIQMAKSISLIANGGILYTPRLVYKKDKELISPIVESENLFKKENIDAVKDGMRQTVTNGSARSLNNLAIAVAGKTGTAQFGPNNMYKHAWFVSYAPSNNPDIVLVVLVEGGGEGSETAVPVAKEFFDFYSINPL
jgi:penicillin-binding protein 2